MLRAPASGEKRTTSSIIRIEKGHTIIHQGAKAHYWFEVISGVVRTCRLESNGNRQLLGFCYAGDAFGLDNDRYRETAEAVTSATLRRHQRLSPDDPEAAEKARLALERALTSARNSIVILGKKSARARVATFLLDAAARTKASPKLELMSRADMADHLGLTIYTVSRCIAEMARSGIIELEGRQCFRIDDIEGLRKIAGEDEVDAQPACRLTLAST